MKRTEVKKRLAFFLIVKTKTQRKQSNACFSVDYEYILFIEQKLLMHRYLIRKRRKPFLHKKGMFVKANIPPLV